jgi:hypothetical protein
VAGTCECDNGTSGSLNAGNSLNEKSNLLYCDVVSINFYGRLYG